MQATTFDTPTTPAPQARGPVSIIVDVIAREILDSRGNPTVEVEVELLSGARGRAAVPSGASTGAHEAVELRDGGDRYGGKGVQRAVANVNGEIGEAVVGIEGLDQRLLDQALIELDGTDNKARLGANALLGVSLAARQGGRRRVRPPALPLRRRRERARAAAAVHERAQRWRARRLQRRPAGVHARARRRGVVQRGAAHGRRDVPRARSACCTTAGSRPALGDEGGFAPDLPSNEEAVKLLVAAIEAAGYTPGDDIAIALDTASTEFFDGRQVHARRRGPRARRPPSSPATSRDLCDRYPIVSIEDGMAEDDWDGWAALDRRARRPGAARRRRPVRHQPGAAAAGHRRGVANSILIKVNQIGTLTETLDTMALAARHGYTSMMSHRSGETEDVTIADLAVATNCGQMLTRLTGNGGTCFPRRAPPTGRACRRSRCSTSPGRPDTRSCSGSTSIRTTTRTPVPTRCDRARSRPSRPAPSSASTSGTPAPSAALPAILDGIEARSLEPVHVSTLLQLP